MKIKSFRGLIGDGEENTIPLKTNNGSTGYKIVKFQLFPNKPGTTTVESTVSIFKIPGKGSGSTTAVVDFSDNTLLAAAFYQDRHEATYVTSESIVFDNEIFNQDIYVTMTDTVGTEAMNYYIELEQMPLALDENTEATLKDIRNITE